jgi:hypothetical protein
LRGYGNLISQRSFCGIGWRYLIYQHIFWGIGQRTQNRQDILDQLSHGHLLMDRSRSYIAF